MAFTVTDFKTNLVAGGGGARPSLFKIDINSENTGLSFSDSANILVKAASLPANNIAPLPVNYGGRAYKLNGFRTFDPWAVTVIQDEDFTNRTNIIHWMKKIAGNMDGERVPDTTVAGVAYAGTTWNYQGTATGKQFEKQ